ncbi:MAG: DUF1732 domain-containing protein, partial [Planctomycetes bacterium]|nr:DUF1732 domain-containing protein [Planctomycetota bacterium]
LARDLRKNLSALSLAVRRLRALLPAARREAVERVRARLGEVLGKAVPEGDVLRQAALDAERADVSEEFARIEAHVAQAHRLLRGEGAVGRRLEFLAQEMNREANTISSKCGAPALLGAILAAREAADRLREQAANVE